MLILIRRLLGLGLRALPGLQKIFSATTKPSMCINAPDTRNCWLPGYDINTDYTRNLAPPGKVVEYDLIASQEIISPDGYTKLGMVINGQYPGPTIEADWGDTLRITVHNNFTDNKNGTTIHWHGIRQYNTNWQDGVPGVTQCPIKPGDSQTYEFRALQYGTSWYHGHLSLQYSNGLYGPLVIHGPSSANYDVDLGPWLLSDWYHADMFSLDQGGMTTGHETVPESSLLNGKGVFACNPAIESRCTGDGEYFQVVFEPGTKYRIGLVNSASTLTYTFYIDGHNFTVSEIDFVPIEPFVTDVLNIAIGQRYEIIIEANAALDHGPNFWIHAQYCAETWILDSRVGIVRYDLANTSDPITPSQSQRHLEFGCDDPEPSQLRPVVRQDVGARVNNMTEADHLRIGRLNANWPGTPLTDGPVFLWVLQDTPVYLNWSEPSVAKITGLSSDTAFPDHIDPPIQLDYETGQWVHFVITSNYSDSPTDPVRAMPETAHPMHLHGHDFAVLAQGHGPFERKAATPLLTNPARRDTADVPIGGWIWIAFQVDNPGAWVLHCHIAFHASDGLALQYLEQASKLRPLMDRGGVVNDFMERCSAWTEWYDTVSIPAQATQADSGI